MNNRSIVDTKSKIADFAFEYIAWLGFWVTGFLIVVAEDFDVDRITWHDPNRIALLLLPPLLFTISKRGLKSVLAPRVSETLIQNPTGKTEISAVLPALRNRARILRFVSFLLVYTLWVQTRLGVDLFKAAEQNSQESTPTGFAVRRIEELFRERDAIMATNSAALRLTTISNLIEVYERRLDPQTVKVNEAADTVSTVNTVTTKVGAIFLIIFIAKILVELCTYTINQASFFDACADAIQASPSDSPEEIMKYFNVLHSQRAKLGGAPDTMIETAMKKVGPVIHKLVSLNK